MGGVATKAAYGSVTPEVEPQHDYQEFQRSLQTLPQSSHKQQQHIDKPNASSQAAVAPEPAVPKGLDVDQVKSLIQDLVVNLTGEGDDINEDVEFWDYGLDSLA